MTFKGPFQPKPFYVAMKMYFSLFFSFPNLSCFFSARGIFNQIQQPEDSCIFRYHLFGEINVNLAKP